MKGWRNDNLQGGLRRYLEKDEEKWIKKMRDLKIVNDSGQFRVEDPKNSALNTFFNLYTIPRYIVLDRTGKILEEDFKRPGDPKFKKKLQSYLRKDH